MTSSGSPTSLAPAHRPRRRRRWIVAVVLIGVVSVAAVVTVRVILSGDTPRQILVEQAGRATGLDVQIRELKVSWNGNSIAKGISVRLPLDAKPFLTVESVEVRHAPIHKIIFSGDPGLSELVLDGVTITLSEDARGRWTPQRMAALLDAAFGSASGSGGGALPLPAITIADAAVYVNKQGQPTQTFPLSLSGTPTSIGEYHAEVTSGQSTISADFSTVAFDHTATFSLFGLDALVTALVPDAPTPFVFRGTWAGDLDSGLPSGKLAIDELRAGEDALHGSLSLAVQDGTITVSPESLTLATKRFGRQPVRVAGGDVSITGDVLTLSGINLEVPGIKADLSGSWNLAKSSGDLLAVWEGSEADLGIAHRGHASLEAALPERGQRFIAGTIESAGEAPQGAWDAESSFSVTSRDWQSMQAQVSMPRFILTDPVGQVDLSSMRLAAEYAGNTLTLKSLAVPFAKGLVTSGRLDTQTMRWSASLEAKSIAPPRLTVPLNQVRLLASGEADRVQISDLSLEADGLTVGLVGTFEPEREVPLLALMSFHRSLPEIQADERAKDSTILPPVVVGTLEVAGDPFASRATASGLVTVSNLRYADTVLPPREMTARADWADHRIELDTDSFELLGGETSLWASLDLATNTLVGHIRLACIDLTRVASAIDPELKLTGDGFGEFGFTMPDLDPDALRLVGDWSVNNASTPVGPIDAGRGRVTVNYPDVEVSDVELSRGDTTLTGIVRMDANLPELIAADVMLRRYGFDDSESGVSALIDSHAVATIDLAKKEARGTVSLDATAAIDGQELSKFGLAATLDGRTAQTSAIKAELFGGTVSGSARMPVDDWTKLAMDLTISEMDLARLRHFAPKVELTGRLGGTISVRPAKDKNALSPLRIETNLTTMQGAWGPIGLGDLKMIAFAGSDRAVIDEGLLGFASGSVAFWSRGSLHDGQPFVHLSLDARGLDLSQLVAAASPGSAPVVGVIDGSAVVGGYATPPHRGFGDADIRLSNADIGGVPVVSQLYNLLSLDLGSTEPKGIGQVRLRLEGDALQISQLRFFNRGADLLGNGRVDNIWIGDQSEVTGSIAAAIRPLGDSKLPFGAGVDRVLSGLFENAVSVNVSGTLSKPTIKTVPFADVSAGLQRMLGTAPAK